MYRNLSKGIEKVILQIMSQVNAFCKKGGVYVVTRIFMGVSAFYIEFTEQH